MASGDVKEVRGRTILIKSIDGATGTDDGKWWATGDFNEVSFHLAPGVGTLQARGSNKDTVPAVTDDEAQIGSDATAHSIIVQSPAPKWVRAMVSAHTSGTHNAYILLRRTHG